MNKVIAFDFDGVIAPKSDVHNGCNTYPIVTGKPRKYTKEVINYLLDHGATVVIWTCREGEDLNHAKNWMRKHNIMYDNINKNVYPWQYDARKIFAHMYVDDRAFGWRESDDIMLEVLITFMIRECGMSATQALNDAEDIRLGVDNK